MTHTLEAPKTPDLAAVKERQQQAWASGDYHAVAARIVVVAELLMDAADLHAGWRVLDVATGTGYLALAAASLGHRVRAIDLAAPMLDELRAHAAARGLAVDAFLGDAVAPALPPARPGRRSGTRARSAAPSSRSCSSRPWRMLSPVASRPGIAT